MARKARRRVGEKRLQMVINKIACARSCSLTSLVRSASPNGAWRVLWVQSASCLSSQSSLSVWWVHSFSSHRCEFLWSPTDFGTRHDIKQEPLTPQQKKNRHMKEGRDWLSDFRLVVDLICIERAAQWPMHPMRFTFLIHFIHSFYAYLLYIY